MGDSGSQVIGFGLAALALASSWTTAGATLTSVLLPLLVLAIPILDTTLVTVRRTARATAGHAGRHRPHLAPARLLRPVRAASRAGAHLARRASRRDRARVHRSRQPAGDRGRRARLLRRARAVRELPRRPRGALAPRGGRSAALALAGAHLASPSARRGARRLRDHLRLLPRRLPAVRRRRGHAGSARDLPLRPAGSAGGPVRPLRRLRHLPARLAFRVGARPGRDRSRGDPVGADHGRDRRQDADVAELPARDLPRRRAAVHDAHRWVAPRLAPAASPRGRAAKRADARAHRRRRTLRPGARARARGDARSPRRRLPGRQPERAPAPSARGEGARRPRRGGGSHRGRPGRTRCW